MKTFKQYLIEGVFSVHNAHVVHKALMDHVRDNAQIVSNHFKNRRYYTVNAKTLNPKFDDLDIHLEPRKAPHGSSSDLHSGGGFDPGFISNTKPHLKVIVGFEPHQQVHNPDHIQQQLGNVNHRGIFVHEFTHFADTNDKVKTHGKTSAIASHYLAHLAAKTNDDEYYNNPGEVRAFQREIAYTAREKKKTGEHKSTVDLANSLHPVYKKFIEYTKPKNSEPLVNYLLKVHK